MTSLAKFLVQVVYLVKPGFIEFNKMVDAQEPETRERLKEGNLWKINRRKDIWQRNRVTEM